MFAKRTHTTLATLASAIVMGTLPAAGTAQPSWELRATDGPSPRLNSAMAYDSCRGVTVLFGGSDMSGTFQDTWEWDGDAWSLRGTTGPGPKRGHSMAFDKNRCVTVLFGGNDAVGNYFNDTWEWDGSTWTQRCASCPPPTRHGAGMVFDSTRGLVLLFGGYSPGLLNDTWQWDGSSWIQVSTTSPPSPRSWPAMAYDSARDRIVVFGGALQAVSCNLNADETWELDKSTSPAMWTQVTTSTQPSPRHRPRMVYDSAHAVMVLVGGTDNCTNVFGDTWEYDGSTWSLISTPTAPSPRNYHALAFDSVRGQALLFGGTTDPVSPAGSNDILGDTWSYGANQAPTCELLDDRQLVLERWLENVPVGTPNVIQDGGGYSMWFDTHFVPGRAGLFHATSVDGVMWTSLQPSLLPGSAGWEAIHVYNSAVIKEGPLYKMWYTGYGGSNNRIGYATSTDGINWTKYAGNPVVQLGAWDSRVVRVGSVLLDASADLYKMWYTGGSGWFHALQVGYATSPDGITWTKHPLPVFTFGPTTEWITNHVNVVRRDSLYEMHFSSSTRDIRRATSVDGINWTLDACGAAVEPTTASWDSVFVGGASVLLEGGARKIWYDGGDGIRSGIGFAQSGIPTCGDGIIDPGEECDDSNAIDGDGCSSTCRVEGPETVPTVSGWGLTVMVLLLLTGIRIKFGGRQPARP